LRVTYQWGFCWCTDVVSYAKVLEDLSKDETVPLTATNLVYITLAPHPGKIESKIVYSIFNKNPKRAHTYWLLHVHITDEPHTREYSIEKIIPGVLIRIDFRLGFKVQPRINLYFKHILEELEHGKEINLESEFPALHKHHIPADFYYIVIRRIQNYDFDFDCFSRPFPNFQKFSPNSKFLVGFVQALYHKCNMQLHASLQGNYSRLSKQKFSSNVVEKCLKVANNNLRTNIINELMEEVCLFFLSSFCM